MQNFSEQLAIIFPVGPGTIPALDTLESVEHFCPEPHVVFIVDDHTNDGTYEALVAAKKPKWHIFRNKRPQGIRRLVHTLCFAYKQVLDKTDCQLILRLDQDALFIGFGLFSEAFAFIRSNNGVGMFGTYDVDYNRPRNFDMHRRLITKEIAWYRSLVFQRPSWKAYLFKAEHNGYKRGDNVFGGAYFITRECLSGMRKLGALNVPWNWHSQLDEDVYFSMIAVAAGFQLGHFSAPNGPLCMEWRGLPYPATKLAASNYKLVHSVDKGPNTGSSENGGRTAREVFRKLRV